MNVHLAASLEAETELRLISHAKEHIISAQGSKPNYAIVQDSLLGAYKMTLGLVKIRKDRFQDLCMLSRLTLPEIQAKIQSIRRVFKAKNKKVQAYHGKGLISLAFPNDFEFTLQNKADPNEPIVKIHQGVLYEGALDKRCLGPVVNGLIHRIHKEYGPDITSNFIDIIQFLTNGFLLTVGFSIGLGDCVVSGPDKVEAIEDAVRKCYIEAEGISTSTNHPGIREARIMGALSKARDIGLKIAKDALAPTNCLRDTVTSGSKGDYFNIAQITGLLGQQNIMGKRVQKTMTNGRRTLPHYPITDLSTEMEYESRGFITSSFIKGLNPREFYFHMMSGREGVCNTATDTAKSGYIQRKCVKLTEDIKTEYDGTVRDTTGKIYQLAYGGTGIDPKKTIRVNGKQQPCDAGSVAEKLNLKYEMRL